MIFHKYYQVVFFSNIFYVLYLFSLMAFGMNFAYLGFFYSVMVYIVLYIFYFLPVFIIANITQLCPCHSLSHPSTNLQLFPHYPPMHSTNPIFKNQLFASQSLQLSVALNAMHKKNAFNNHNRKHKPHCNQMPAPTSN